MHNYLVAGGFVLGRDFSRRVVQAMRKILLTSICVVALAALVACGSYSSSNKTVIPTPPSTGNNAGFSNSSLKGSYVFSANGATSNNFYATAGVFTADGAGTISSGTRDTFNDAGNQAQNESVTGTYSVNQDGRGQAVLNGSSGQIIYRFVLQSSTSAKLFQISNGGDATGVIALQTSVPAALSGTYIARLDGEDGNLKPYGAIGGLTASGTTVSGQIDENDNGVFHPQLAATGPFSISANGRGTLMYTTSTGSHNFVFYAVSPGSIELVSTDKHFFLHGHAELQTSIAPTAAAFAGDQVFNISGNDSNGSILETGRLTLDGAGNLTNAIEDYNEAGFYFDSVLFTSGSYSVAANGRWTANLTYAINSSSLSLVGWQVSTQQSIILTTALATVPVSNFTILETGTMRAQTTSLTTASVTGNYAEDLSGFLVNNGTVESAGNFDADGAGNLSGTIDSQTPFNINTDVPQTGNYSIAANGRSSGTIGSVPVHFYTVDANTIYLIATDPNRLYQGMMVKQQ